MNAQELTVRQLVARAKCFATAPEDANQAMQTLIVLHKGLLKHCARFYGSDMPDAYAIALSGLWEAVAAFDEEVASRRRCKFSTFATWCIRGKLSRARLHEINETSDAETMQDESITSARAVEDQVEARLLEQTIIKALRAYAERTPARPLVQVWELLRAGCQVRDVACALNITYSRAIALTRVVRRIARSVVEEWNAELV